MSIVYTKAIKAKWSLDDVKDEGPTYKNVWLVRTDNPGEDLADIRDAPGVAIGDVVTDANAQYVICKSLSVQAADSSGLLWEVTASFEPRKPEEGGEEGGGEGGGGGQLPIPVWSATGSSSTVPVYKDSFGDMITNSAGDPLEGLEKEQSEFTLLLTKPYLDHAEWRHDAKFHTDTVNDADWNDGAQGTWLCRFRSASLERTEGLVYWSVQYEFAYRKEGWALKPWDIGFHKLESVDGGYERKTITTSDGKSVKQPVALAPDGTPLPPGSPPLVINDGNGAFVYSTTNFAGTFGELFTPAI